MDKNRRKFLKFLLMGTGLLAIAKIFGVNWAKAWTEPGAVPPGGNIPTPLNISATDQTKQGGLTVQGKLEATTRLKIPVGTDLYN
jgi:hypothetical protein